MTWVLVERRSRKRPAGTVSLYLGRCPRIVFPTETTKTWKLDRFACARLFIRQDPPGILLQLFKEELRGTFKLVRTKKTVLITLGGVIHMLNGVRPGLYGASFENNNTIIISLTDPIVVFDGKGSRSNYRSRPAPSYYLREDKSVGGL